MASEPAATLVHTLAHVQALLLYQIIRFLEGDWISRATADAAFCYLVSSTQVMLTHFMWHSKRGVQDGQADRVPDDLSDRLAHLIGLPQERLSWSTLSDAAGDDMDVLGKMLLSVWLWR